MFITDSISAGEALDEYYRTHYFGKNAMTDNWVFFRIGPLRLPFPNLRRRKEVIHLHDLHLVSPRKVAIAFRKGWGKKNLCHLNMPKEELLKMSLASLKRKLE